MKRAMRKLCLVGLSVVGLILVSFSAHAAVTFVNLGTAAPPATVGGYAMQPFALAPQAAIANGTPVTTIPGSPVAGSLTLDASLDKHAVPGGGWSTWSHGYAGPVFGVYTPITSRTLTLPPNAGAFYFYVEPQIFGVFNIQAVSDSGTSSGQIPVNGSGGATGFAFYAGAGESIQTITITAPAAASGFAIAEFGIAAPTAVAAPALSEWSMFIMMALVVLCAFVLMRRAAW